jgi:hypothetical protein
MAVDKVSHLVFFANTVNFQLKPIVNKLAETEKFGTDFIDAITS